MINNQHPAKLCVSSQLLQEEKLQTLREEVKQIKSQQAEDSSDSEEFVDLSKQAQQLQHTRDALIDSDAAR